LALYIIIVSCQSRNKHVRFCWWRARTLSCITSSVQDSYSVLSAIVSIVVSCVRAAWCCHVVCIMNSVYLRVCSRVSGMLFRHVHENERRQYPCFKGFECPYVNKTKRGNAHVNVSGAIPLLPSPPSPSCSFIAWTVNNRVFTSRGAWRILNMFTRAQNWTLYFPRQFSPVHTTYALRLFKVRVIGICYLCRDFPRNSRQSITCGLCFSQKTVHLFHVISLLHDWICFLFLSMMKANVVRPDFLSYTPAMGMNPVRRK